MQNNLYKLVIIDDEEIIRRGLSEFVNWEELGFELVSSFEDGKEAIEFLKTNKVNVVLTDIKMAEISGLEVAKYLHENMPNVKTVIISGYKEFEYAQKAIEYNVEHYLLKPTDFRNVYKVFSAIRSKLDEQFQKNKLKNDNMQKLEEMLPMLQRQFFIDIILGAIRDRKNIDKRYNLIGLKFELEGPCSILDFKINKLDEYLNSKWNHGKSRLMIALGNFIKESYVNVCFIPVYFFDDHILVCSVSLKPISMKEYKKQIQKNIQKIIGSIHDILNLDISLDNSKYFDGIYDIYRFNKENKFIPNKIKGNPNEFFSQKYKLLISNINECNIEDVDNILDSLLEQIKELPIDIIQKNVIDLFVVISKKYLHINMNALKHNNCFDYRKILTMNNIDEISEYCKNSFRILISLVEQHKDISSNKIIKKAIKYMEKHYNEDISLENVANHVYFNSVYFSRFFKQQTGENFIDYLTKIRMEQAIKLLKAKKYKIYEVSEKTGYKSSKYFTRVFKQYTGYTPKEYIVNVINEVS